MKGEYGSEEFWMEYRAALEGAPPTGAPKAHTLAWALDRYHNSSAWAGLSTATRRQRENIYRAVIKTAGTVLLRDVSTATIRSGREPVRDAARGKQLPQGDAGILRLGGRDWARAHRSHQRSQAADR
jgi:hypothetical protein